MGTGPARLVERSRQARHPSKQLYPYLNAPRHTMCKPHLLLQRKAQSRKRHRQLLPAPAVGDARAVRDQALLDRGSSLRMAWAAGRKGPDLGSQGRTRVPTPPADPLSLLAPLLALGSPCTAYRR